MTIVRYATRTGDSSPLWIVIEEVLLNKNNATEPVAFHRWLENLVENLSSAAASDASRFAVGSTNYTDVDKLYALLQCTRDLSEKNCLTCLQDIFSYIPRVWYENRVSDIFCELQSPLRDRSIFSVNSTTFIS